jgi:threonine dehydrogenase-like Zn-dependent dehydrogenase
MQAIALVPGTTNIRLVDRPEPEIRSPRDVKLRVLQVGICGTDREEAAGGRADAPPGQPELVIGHEMIGQVVATGPAVRAVQAGDYAVVTVRRPCGHCPPCAGNRSDLCESGDYTERGIRRRDGFQTQVVVDEEPYLVKVPADLGARAVLAEPTSVAEKAINEALGVQKARLPDAADPVAWIRGKKVLVAGLGPIGLLAALALTLRGASVLGLDIVLPGSPRPRLLEQIGGTYVGGPGVRAESLGEHFGQIALIVEATGVAALGINGVYVLTGIPGGDRPVTVDGPSLMRQLVLRNQVMIGSVNASPRDWQMAVEDLAAAHRRWPAVLDALVTDRLPYGEFARALSHHGPDEIKTVIEWARA